MCIHSVKGLCRSGALANMQSHGIEAVDCFAVDNALIKPADPLFIGHCYTQQTDCGRLLQAPTSPSVGLGPIQQTHLCMGVCLFALPSHSGQHSMASVDYPVYRSYNQQEVGNCWLL